MYASLKSSTGMAKLKLTKRIDEVEQQLAWQGANPKQIPFAALREYVQLPHGDDALSNRYRARIKNRASSIRAKCVECQGGDTAGVRLCPSVTCPLHPFRMGKDPLRGWDIPKFEMPDLEFDDDDIGDFEDGDSGNEKDETT